MNNDSSFRAAINCSSFFQTPLPALLEHLKVKHLLLTAVACDPCVLTNAMDAHIGDFEQGYRRYTLASITPSRNQRALHCIGEILGGSVAPILEC